MAVIGVSMLGFVVMPVIGYELKARGEFIEYLSPIPEQEIDYTKLASWFPNSLQNESSSLVRFYNLSVKKLGIKGAVVSVGGEDLADSLIQYPGTALPGKRGNTVVFGHSVLPSFFDPKVYLTIFSTLPTMRKGDTIDIDYDGISYKYKVFDMFEVLPTELSVLSQETEESILSLVTCVPPGDPRRPRRLVVKARLIPAQEYTNI